MADCRPSRPRERPAVGPAHHLRALAQPAAAQPAHPAGHEADAEVHRPLQAPEPHRPRGTDRVHRRLLLRDEEVGPEQQGHDLHLGQDAAGHPPAGHRSGQAEDRGQGPERGRERGHPTHGDVKGTTARLFI